MFLDYFRLREQPFGVTPDPRFLYPSPGHREALASLIYGIESNLGFGSLIARPGMGKTTLLFHILEQYRQSARTAFIFNTQCDSSDLLRSLLAELDDQPVPEQALAFHLHERFKQILAKELQARRRVILVIDEAQNLDHTAMETIRLLSNFESANFKLLYIVLAGQPELSAKLRRPELSQLQQRIPIFASLEHLSHEEIFMYIDHRLRVAGHIGRPLFTRQAITEIAGLSQGVPREINRVCFNSLSLAYASSKPVVDSSVVEEVATDLGLSQLLRQEREEGAVVRDVTTTSSRAAPPTAPISAPRREPATQAGQAARRIPEQVRAAPGSASGATRPVAPLVRHKNPYTRRRNARSRMPFSLSNGWQACRRPVAFALFYLTLIAAGWAGIIEWAHPNSQSSSAKAAGEVAPSAELAKVSSTMVSHQDPVPSTKEVGKNSGISLPGQALALAQSSRSFAPRQQGIITSGPTAFFSSFELPLAPPSGAVGPLPELVRYSGPSYPEAARDRHIEGTVVLSAVITRDGRVKGIKRVSGDPMLLGAAESAVQTWLYRPYRIDGKPVDVNTEIVIRFSLPKGHTP